MSKTFSINLALVSRDLVARLAKRIPSSRSFLKKLLPMDKRLDHSTLVRGRSPFSTSKQFDTNVGTEGATATSTLTIGPSQGGFFRGTQLENRPFGDSRSSDLQCRHLWRFSSLSSSIHARKTLPYPGQCQMAQVQRSQGFFRSKPGTFSIYLLTRLFARTQSDRTSLENYSQESYSQSLFSFNRKFAIGFAGAIFNMESTKHCS